MLSIKNMMKLISCWPPYWIAGISVAEYDLDAGFVVSKLSRNRFNGNTAGAHFGGSLYAMCDPWFSFLAKHHLGKEYIVWDIQSEVKFLKATDDPVFGLFEMPQDMIKKIKDFTERGGQFAPRFTSVVTTKSGEVVAEISKTIYVRKKRKKTSEELEFSL